MPIKNRYELRFKDEKAEQAIHGYTKTGDLTVFLLGILSDYLCFVDRKGGVSRKYWPVNKNGNTFLAVLKK